MEDTQWKFTAPQEGEVDSAEKKADTLREIDRALPSPDVLSQLTARGTKPESITDTSYVWDPDQGIYVTTLHSHPLPKSVPYAEKANEANSARTADIADKARMLDPGFSINGKPNNGTQNTIIYLNDIPDAPRVFYGTQEPSKNASLPKQLREKDIYIKIS